MSNYINFSNTLQEDFEYEKLKKKKMVYKNCIRYVGLTSYR